MPVFVRFVITGYSVTFCENLSELLKDSVILYHRSPLSS